MLTNAYVQGIYFHMTQILLLRSVIIARMFTSVTSETCLLGRSENCTNQGVATIGGKGRQPSGIGTVRWIWRDDSGKSHEYLVKDALFYPQYPINILSVTFFARQLNDLTGTGIDTKQLTSCFYWESSKYSLTIHHPPSNLPEISINEGFALSTMFRA